MGLIQGPPVEGKLDGHAFDMWGHEEYTVLNQVVTDCNYHYAIRNDGNKVLITDCVSTGHGNKKYGAVIQGIGAGDLRLSGNVFDLKMQPLNSYTTDPNHDICDWAATCGEIWSCDNQYKNPSDGVFDIKASGNHYFVNDNMEGGHRMIRPWSGAVVHLINCTLKTTHAICWFNKMNAGRIIVGPGCTFNGKTMITEEMVSADGWTPMEALNRISYDPNLVAPNDVFFTGTEPPVPQPKTITLTALGSGYFRVYVNGSETTKHLTEREAIESAITEVGEPNTVTYKHDYEVEVK